MPHLLLLARMKENKARNLKKMMIAVRNNKVIKKRLDP